MLCKHVVYLWGEDPEEVVQLDLEGEGAQFAEAARVDCYFVNVDVAYVYVNCHVVN